MKTVRVQIPGDPIRATLRIHENRHPRPLTCLSDRGRALDDEFGYIRGEEIHDARLFEYRGSWYDSHEFVIAPNWIKALGYDAWQTESAVSAVVLSWFDRDGHPLDDQVIVGYIHW